MRKSIEEIKDLYKGKDIYVIGSGVSIDSYDLSFFRNKISVGCNYVSKKIETTFTICTHKEVFQNNPDLKTYVISEGDPSPEGMSLNEISTTNDYYTFKVGKYNDFDCNLNDVGKADTLCMGNTIATMAINLAAHLGADSIILVGIDCCTVNGKQYYKGYQASIPFYPLHDTLAWEQYRHYTNDFFIRNPKEINLLKQKIKEVYGCTMASLSPYIGLKNNEVLLKDYLSLSDIKKLGEI